MMTKDDLKAGFRAAFKISAKTGINVEDSFDFLIRQILAVERDGLYSVLYRRDHNVRRLTTGDDRESSSFDVRRSIKDTFNVCC